MSVTSIVGWAMFAVGMWFIVSVLYVLYCFNRAKTLNDFLGEQPMPWWAIILILPVGLVCNMLLWLRGR